MKKIIIVLVIFFASLNAANCELMYEKLKGKLLSEMIDNLE